MSKTEAKKIAKKYAQELQSQNFPFFGIYLFGSYAKGSASLWSDIDIAVISDELKKNTDKNRLRLWRIRRAVDSRIEPHPFTIKDFQDNANPLAYEVKKTGIKIK